MIYVYISINEKQDPNTITVPNILHYYSHNLYGASVGDHLISICFGNPHPTCSENNVTYTS